MRPALPLLLLLSACSSWAIADRPADLPQHQPCRTSIEDRQWLGKALAAWPTVLRDFLKAPGQELPQIVTYDAQCSYTLPAATNSGSRWSVTEHGGQITLPNGRKIPPAPNAFNAVTDAGHNFVVIALPSIWRPVAPKSEIPLEWFLEGVLLHEMAHAYQAQVTPQISFPALLKRLPATANISDDSIQEAFEKDQRYVRDYEAERDLLFRAASAPTDAKARALACEALAALRTRRQRHFTGANAHWTLVDEMSLTTEGLGQWVAYKWVTQGRGLQPTIVLPKLRGPFWSQEQGLATFLVVDRLVPDWQGLLFSSTPETASHLLARACEGEGATKPSARSTAAASAAR